MARLVLLQEAEQRLHWPRGSLAEAAGVGTDARRQLEEVLCGLILVVPEVRARLQTLALPFSTPQLRAIAESALQRKPRSGRLYTEAGRLAQAVGGFGRHVS